MQKHYAHYLKRVIRLRHSKEEKDLFYSQPQGLEEGFDAPMFHITKQSKGPVARINAGDVFWLFSVLKSPWGHTTPSLDAKIEVKKIERTEEGYTKFGADSKSFWFMLNNASSIIEQLLTFDINKNMRPLQIERLPIGQCLQGIREIGNPDVLVKYARFVSTAHFDFISYRIKDGTKMAFQKVVELLENQKVVFWDRYSLPRRLAERREFVSDNKLDEYLIQKIRESKNVWGIESDKYAAEGTYSLKECEIAMELKKYISVSESR